MKLTGVTGALAIALLSWPLAAADQVVMKNGDRLTGSIVKYDGKSLTMKTEFAGEVSIDWDSVVEFTAEQPLNLTLSDQQKLVGTVGAQEGKIAVATAEAGRVTVEKSAIQAIRNKDEEAAYVAEIERLRNPGLLDLWGGHVDFGYAAARGNAETTTFSLGFNADRTTSRDELSVYLKSIRASNSTTGDKVQTANATRGGLQYNLRTSARSSLFGFTDLEFDEFQALDLRFVTGGGMEYEAIKREFTQFKVSAGGALNKEFFNNDVSRTSGELRFGQEFKQRLFGVTTLEEKLVVFPNLSETGEYRLNLDVGTVTALKKWLSIQFSISDRYLSNPLFGKDNNDILFTAGIRVTFDKAAWK